MGPYYRGDNNIIIITLISSPLFRSSIAITLRYLLVEKNNINMHSDNAISAKYPQWGKDTRKII